MKHLHEVRQDLIAPVLFFGRDTPCMNNYHDGFDLERTHPEGHEACAENTLAEVRDALREQGTYAAGTRCRCHPCTDAQPGLMHYFITLADRRGNMPTECPNCLEGYHPIDIDDRTTDTSENQIVGTAQDHAHYGDEGAPEDEGAYEDVPEPPF